MAQPADSARTVIMTVDDDPGVSRAVARDLRRRYGASYRIVRAESGESALDALRVLKLRGDLVAVILADYRMPRMNGIAWYWDYSTNELHESGPEPAAPVSHAADQPVPGPAGRVPDDWARVLRA
ncbi:hypothetical protein C1J00_16085 [Streptomyces cahuitamycinicus]|uniref:Response regulatory domain-containing protein n=1 Tax=Streptomyces cahuitamycinicus TaxID=2070367 RepID=A0A2N8TQC6_9ACTN|nr:response regulator [Streptomyces cahuitamycinicus]PNG21218.1 hypothetical protein C1J00_16085 [Streptomyces cahuitamycinicus]